MVVNWPGHWAIPGGVSAKAASARERVRTSY
jgi:hypothetical protein